MNSKIIRQKFFDYFKKFHHEQVASSSLIPAQDPTILFTNAGMNQFKDVLLGKEKRSYSRAVTIQKCVRAGGKHNDLDNVGFTQRHLTFFEMMGNFSFGDYFKKEAIPFAWNFLTQDIGIDSNKLSVSVHYTDDESYAIWKNEIKVPEHKIFKLDADNFWQMGDVGPCGPCTEIFFDRGPQFGCGKSDCNVPCGCDRFLEVWNVVFMQYDRQSNGKDILLKQTGIDTGMGLERLCVVVQNKESVFDIDLFQPCIRKIEELTGYNYHTATGIIKASCNVLLDHIRSTSFLIADGCAPSNEGRGYVIRKIIRRAALFAQKLTDKNIFPQLASVLIDEMKEYYPELQESKERIITVLTLEIERFTENLIRGRHILENYIQENGVNKIVSGIQAFTLYDTYGFPLEVVQLIASEHGCTVDIKGFEIHMELQRQKSGKKMKQTEQELSLPASISTQFTGYQSTYETSHITALVLNNYCTDSIQTGQSFWFAVEKTPFYVACGGQVDDQGTVTFGAYQTAITGLKKLDNAILIECIAPTTITLGDTVEMQVDVQTRLATMKNHTATHLLQSALQSLLGKAVKQAGSIVTPDYLRFDFTYHQALTPHQIITIENMINQKIWENISVTTQNTTLKEATENGVIAFFGDKYNPDAVRAVIIPGFSAELCGGTHVQATGDIGLFKIIQETALAAGQRRIIAYTGPKALHMMQENFNLINSLEQIFKVKSESLLEHVEKQQYKIKELSAQLKQFKSEQLKSLVPSWIKSSEMINNIPYAYIQLSDFAENLRDIATMLQSKNPGFYFIINQSDNKVLFIGSIAKELTDRINMKDFQTWLQEHCNVRSGGNNTTIQGGGDIFVDNLSSTIKNWLLSHSN